MSGLSLKKQHGVVTKSTWSQWRKKKIEFVVRIKREQEKKSVRQKIASVPD